MKYLLDTCVLSEMTKPRPSASVLRWLERSKDADVAVSVLTMGELEKGVRRLPLGERRNALDRWLHEIRTAYADRLLEVTLDVAVQWGRIAARSEARGMPLPVIDALIGATATVHGLTVVTRNTSDVERSGAKVLDPWS